MFTAIARNLKMLNIFFPALPSFRIHSIFVKNYLSGNVCCYDTKPKNVKRFSSRLTFFPATLTPFVVAAEK